MIIEVYLIDDTELLQKFFDGHPYSPSEVCTGKYVSKIDEYEGSHVPELATSVWIDSREYILFYKSFYPQSNTSVLFVFDPKAIIGEEEDDDTTAMC